MGHIIFIFLHLVGVILGFWMLVITIPAHLIYAATKSNAPAQARASPDTHVRCPDCRELVLREARACKHCGCKLIPQ